MNPARFQLRTLENKSIGTQEKLIKKLNNMNNVMNIDNASATSLKLMVHHELITRRQKAS